MGPQLTLAARPLKPPIGKIHEIFLGATVKDLDNIRQGLCIALRNARTAVYLQEHWNRASADVVKTCLDMLERSSGYLGVFGFYYGWVPDGSQYSITELECIWARQRWGSVHPPPIFTFLPEVASAADQELRAMAEHALLSQYPDDASKRDEHTRRQADFVRRLCDEGNIVAFFKDTDELKQKAISSILLWNQELLEKALRREVGANYLIPHHELGEIGRKPQLRALEDMLIARDDREDAPAFCAIAYGPPNSGLGVFSACLAGWDGWQDLARDVEPGRPPRQPYTIASLIKWALSNIAPRPAAEATIDGLAEIIATRLEHGPEVLLLQDLDSLEGGFSSFAGFWSALNTALCKRWKRGTHRFSMIAMTTTPPASDDPAIWRGDPISADYSRLLLLPTLGPLTPEDVERWLDVHRVPQAHRIAERVTRSGIPVEVYDQLNAAGIWRQVIERRR
jgi:hypothetical protein